MEEIFTRFWNDIIARIDGPMKFRIILQPLMSLFLAYKAGKRDAASGSVPYFSGLIINKGHKKEMIRQGWNDVGKVFLAALIIDIIYQLLMIFAKKSQSSFYPVETILTAVVLGFIPYLIFRGPFNRIFRRKHND